jgi:hypothetical protein
MLQANDSALPATVSDSPLPLPPEIITTNVTSDRDYLVTKRQVVALGRKTLDLLILLFHSNRTPQRRAGLFRRGATPAELARRFF